MQLCVNLCLLFPVVHTPGTAFLSYWITIFFYCSKDLSRSCVFYSLPMRLRPDVEEAAGEDQSESTQSDSDDCIVHGQAAGRKVSETPLFTFHTPEEAVAVWVRIVVLLSCARDYTAELISSSGKHSCPHVLIVEWFVKVFCFCWGPLRFYSAYEQKVVSESWTESECSACLLNHKLPAEVSELFLILQPVNWLNVQLQLTILILINLPSLWLFKSSNYNYWFFFFVCDYYKNIILSCVQAQSSSAAYLKADIFPTKHFHCGFNSLWFVIANLYSEILSNLSGGARRSNFSTIIWTCN